jgi:hypothetical protein
MVMSEFIKTLDVSLSVSPIMRNLFYFSSRETAIKVQQPKADRKNKLLFFDSSILNKNH